MNRHVVAGMLGLALAGCAQTRSAMPNRGPGLGPVGLSTFPSIHDTINRENPNIDPAELRAVPGRQAVRPGSSTIVYTPGQPISQPPPREPARLASAAAPGSTGASPPPSSVPLEHADRPGPGPAAGPLDPPQTAAMPPSDEAARTSAAAAAASPEPDATPASVPPPVAREPEGPAGPAAPGPQEAAPPQDAPAPPAPEGPPPAEPAAGPEPSPPPQPSPAMPPAVDGAPAAPPGTPMPGAGPAADPSVGAEPDAIPPIELPTPSRSGSPDAASQEPAAGSAETAPPAAPVQPAPDGPGLPPGLPPASEAPPSVPPMSEAPPTLPPGPAAEPTPPASPDAPPPALPPASPDAPPPALPPADAGLSPPPALPGPDPSVGANPDAVPVPTMPKLPAESSDPGAPPIPQALPPVDGEPGKTEPPGAAAVEKVSSLKRDPQVKTTAGDPTVVRSDVPSRKLQEAGKAAATVGDEVITMSELRAAVRDQLKGLAADQRPSEAELNMVAGAVLKELIERSVIVQEAKRQMKDPKRIQFFMDEADRIWRSEELDPLLRQHAAANEYELKEKLTERGQSLDQMRNTFRRQFLAHQFLRSKLGSSTNVSLPEMRDYYNAHLKDYSLPAQVTWREVVIEVDRCPSRPEARARADAALARLSRGEDFAAVARAVSDGPNKAQGGRWETSPGGYAVEAVNAAIESLPMGQVSQVIEGPSSYHIVRVEARREAGPATFSEVQDKVRKSIYEQKTHQAMNTYIAKLRRETFISSVFDTSENEARPVAAVAER